MQTADVLLLAATAWIADAELRARIEQHAADEARHADMLVARAAEIRAGGANATTEDSAVASAGSTHGFAASVCEEFGELMYVASLHVVEQRARRIQVDAGVEGPSTE